MANALTTVLAFGILGVGLIIAPFLRRGRMTRAEILALRTQKATALRQATSGLVKIVGTVGSDQTIPSFYSQAPVVVAQMRHYDVRRNRRPPRILTQVEWILASEFWLDDGSARLLIDPRRVRLELEVVNDGPESGLEEHRFRAGDRVALVGEVRRTAPPPDVAPSATERPFDTGLDFVKPPFVTWRSDPEVYPSDPIVGWVLGFGLGLIFPAISLASAVKLAEQVRAGW